MRLAVLVIACSLFIASGVQAQDIVIDDDISVDGDDINIEGNIKLDSDDISIGSDIEIPQVLEGRQKMQEIMLNSSTMADVKNILMVDAASYGRPLVKMRLGLPTTIVLPNNEAIKTVKLSDVNAFEILHRPTNANPNKIVYLAKSYNIRADLDVTGSSGRSYYFTLYCMPSYSTEEPSLFVYVGTNPIAADAIDNTGDEIEITPAE